MQVGAESKIAALTIEGKPRAAVQGSHAADRPGCEGRAGPWGLRPDPVGRAGPAVSLSVSGGDSVCGGGKQACRRARGGDGRAAELGDGGTGGVNEGLLGAGVRRG